MRRQLVTTMYNNFITLSGLNRHDELSICMLRIEIHCNSFVLFCFVKEMSIAAKNNTQLREGVRFEWSEVKGAQNYICRVHGADIDSTSLLGEKNSLEIPHSKLNLKDPNNKADSVKVYIEVLAIDESEVIGRGGPFAAGK